MSPEIITQIIVGSFGFLVVSLVGIGLSVLIKAVSQIGPLAIAIEKLSGAVERIEALVVSRHNDTENRLNEHFEAIELVRTRIHYMFGKLGVLKWRAEDLGKVLNDMCDLLKLKAYKYEFKDQDWELPPKAMKDS